MRRFNIVCFLLAIATIWFLRPALAGQDYDMSDPWNVLTAQIIETSAKQNGGTPSVMKQCEEKRKTCDYAIFWRLGDGSGAMIKRTADYRNETLQRVVCVMRKEADTVACMNYDTGQMSDMRQTASGQWISEGQ